MITGIAQALKGINEKDPDSIATAVALKIHGVDARNDDTYLTFVPSVDRKGKLFVDSWSSNVILLTWALPMRAGKWTKAATIELTVGRSRGGGYQAAVIVKGWKDGARYNSGGPCEGGTIAEAVEASFSSILLKPLVQFMRPQTRVIPSDDTFLAVKRWGQILTNLAILAWLVLPFWRHLHGAKTHEMFLWYDPIILLGILTVGVGSILLARRSYLDKVHVIAREGIRKGLRGVFDSSTSSDDYRVCITPDELEALENEKFDLGWWLCMFAGVIFGYFILEFLTLFLKH